MFSELLVPSLSILLMPEASQRLFSASITSSSTSHIQCRKLWAYLQADSTEDTKTSFRRLLWSGFKCCSFSLSSPPPSPYFPPFCSTHRSGFRVLIKHGAVFWKVSSSSPHPDEYLEAHCYHGYPARLKSSLAPTETNVAKTTRCPLEQVTRGLM